MGNGKHRGHASSIRNMAVLVALVAIVIAVPLNALAQSPGRIDTQALDDYLGTMVSTNGVPGLAVVVVQGNEVVFQKGYGQARPGAQVTPQTQFYLGSVSKSFTALAAMQLVERGALELDAPVQKYLPWFQVADREASGQITVRNLLNHTSGLSEGADPGAASYSPSLREQVEHMRVARLTAPVGDKFQYDSQNYRILALLVEQASGQSFDAYLQDHVFAPLGMDHSAASADRLDDLAQGYGQFFGLPLPREERFQPAGVGSGYIASTAEDMAQFAVAMLNHGRLGGKDLITEQSYVEMMSPPEGIESEYGMGWIVSTMDGVKIIYHGGSITNFHAFVLMVPEKRAGFVFLSNQNGIIPMLTTFNALKGDMAKLLIDNSLPASTSYRWVFWLLGALAAATIGYQIYRVVRISGRLKKDHGQATRKGWLDGSLNALIPLVVIFGVPFFASTFLGASSASWTDGLGFLPDVIPWLMIVLWLNLAIGVMKLLVLVRHRRCA